MSDASHDVDLDALIGEESTPFARILEEFAQHFGDIEPEQIFLMARGLVGSVALVGTMAGMDEVGTVDPDDSSTMGYIWMLRSVLTELVDELGGEVGMAVWSDLLLAAQEIHVKGSLTYPDDYADDAIAAFVTHVETDYGTREDVQAMADRVADAMMQEEESS